MSSGYSSSQRKVTPCDPYRTQLIEQILQSEFMRLAMDDSQSNSTPDHEQRLLCSIHQKEMVPTPSGHSPWPPLQSNHPEKQRSSLTRVMPIPPHLYKASFNVPVQGVFRSTCTMPILTCITPMLIATIPMM